VFGIDDRHSEESAMPFSRFADITRATPWSAHTPQPDEPPPGEPEPTGPPIGDPPPDPGEAPHSKGVPTAAARAARYAADAEPMPRGH
jgi:hypothetical protein